MQVLLLTMRIASYTGDPTHSLHKNGELVGWSCDSGAWAPLITALVTHSTATERIKAPSERGE